MPPGPAKHISMTDFGVLIRAYEGRLRDLHKLEFTESTEADEGAAGTLMRKARLDVLAEIKRLQAQNRKLECERSRLVKEKGRLNIENRVLADIALAERERATKALMEGNAK